MREMVQHDQQLFIQKRPRDHRLNLQLDEEERNHFNQGLIGKFLSSGWNTSISTKQQNHLIKKTPPIRPMDLISQPKPQSRKMQPQQSPDSSLLHESISHNQRSKAELDNENDTQKGPSQEKLPRSAPLNQNKRLFRPKVDLKVGSEVPKPNLQMKTPPNNPENRDIASSISRHARVAAKASFEEKRSLESSKSNKDLSLKRPTASKKPSLIETSNQDVPNKNTDLQSRRDRTNQDLVNSEKAAEESSILSQKQLEFTLAGFGNHEAPQQQQRERDSSLKSDSPLKKSATVKRNVTPAATGMFISHREAGLKASNTASRNQLLNNSRDLLVEKEKSSPSSENQEDVEKLVEENKQLRNENSKKMEIIDILLHALKQQKDVLPNPNPSQQAHSDLSVAMNPFVDLNKITPNTRESFKKTPERDSFENLKPKVPVPTGEFLSRENLPPYLPPTQDSITPFENIKSQNKFAKVDTLKRNPSYKFQTPPTKDFYRNESSPKINYMKAHLQGIPPETTTPSSASEVSRINARAKLSLYQNSNTPSSSQAPYRSNLASTGEQIMNNNNIGNFESLGFRDAGWLPRDKPPLTSVYLRNNDPKVLHENKNNQPNFIETFYPSNNTISDPYFGGGSSNTLKNLRFLGAQSVKGEVDIMPFKDSPNKFSSNANPREIESLKGIRSQGALIGMSTISIIDMGQNPRAREDVVIDEKPKLYIRDSGALVSDRKIGVQSTDSKTKFPKDIFSVNVKKRFFG